MGKRSAGFKRRPQDAYLTWDPRAVQPLLPHLPDQFTAWEPCAGNGSLTRLIGRGSWILSDLTPQSEGIHQADALEVAPFMYADLIVTNPPWSRPILHPMIEAFRARAPTWLLFDSDWAYTQQARPFLKFCRAIVSVGRVRWIEGTEQDGKDNCSWYCFVPGETETTFYGRV